MSALHPADARVIVAIHQPNFFPWLGYFDKIARSDVFVLLDNVQFPKTGAGAWSNRVRLLIAGEPRWLTAPVDRSYHGFRAISEITFQADPSWRKKMLRTLDLNYRRAPCFAATMATLEPLILNTEERVAAYNEHAIRTLALELGLGESKIQRASDVEAVGSSNELLISLTLGSGGTAYMCGGGADDYQEQETFERAGVPLVYQNFVHPVYPQVGANDFQPGLSVIDALFNVGTDGVRGLLGLS